MATVVTTSVDAMEDGKPDGNGFHGNTTQGDMQSSPSPLSSGPSTPKKRYAGSDLRERSLAMYKSINNMLTLVNKKDSMPLARVTISEAEGGMILSSV